MPETHEHKQTPKDALLEALANCEVGDKFKDVLIIWNTDSGKSGSCDSGLTSSEAGYLCFLFLIWTANANLGVVMGDVKERLFAHVEFEDKGNSPDAE